MVWKQLVYTFGCPYLRDHSEVMVGWISPAIASKKAASSLCARQPMIFGIRGLSSDDFMRLGALKPCDAKTGPGFEGLASERVG